MVLMLSIVAHCVLVPKIPLAEQVAITSMVELLTLFLSPTLLVS